MKLKQVLIAFDQFANTLLGGMADETISARAWREKHWLRPVIDGLFFWQPSHCYQAYLSEVERKQLPGAYR